MSLPVSVVVVNYNGKDYLESCLGAIVREDPEEILLVDSGSTDGSAEDALEEFPVRLLSLGANKGPGAARNYGLAKATQELVLLVDNDVVLEEGCLARLLKSMDSDPSISLVQARSVLGDDVSRIHYDGASFHYLGLISLRNWYRTRSEAGEPGLVRVDCPISLCLLVRKQAVLDVGGYDEAMFYLAEDVAFAYAMRMHGHSAAVEERAICLHLGGTKGLSKRDASSAYPEQRTFLFSRNRWIFLLTHYRWRSLLLLFPGFLIYGGVHFAFSVASGHAGAWFRGKLALLRMLPSLRKRRRLLQKGRKLSDRSLLTCGPLTFNPGLADRGLRSFVRRILSVLLAVWWKLVRWAL